MSLRRLLREEDGQDMTEYTLLMGFVALASVAVFPVITDSIRVIWNVASKHLSNTMTAR